MAIEAPGVHSWTFVAGGDLRAKQFTFVMLNSSGEVISCTGATDNPVGILQNKPNTGEMAEVWFFGISKLCMNTSCTLGNYVGTHTDGRGAVYVHGTDTTKYIPAVVIGATTAAGGVASVMFNCMALARAT